MSKVAVVYWSSTGNTEAMANAVADGIKEKGGEAVLHTCEDFDGSKVAEYDAQRRIVSCSRRRKSGNKSNSIRNKK